jgi:ribosomal protein S18 acetylase RimI-like enzyme
MQRLGIGTHILGKLMAQCSHSSKALTLAVMKINPAIRLYERLGFRVTHEDQCKFYMRSDAAESRGLTV